MKRLLFDSDVLLDVLAQPQPFVIASAQALAIALQLVQTLLESLKRETHPMQGTQYLEAFRDAFARVQAYSRQSSH